MQEISGPRGEPGGLMVEGEGGDKLPWEEDSAGTRRNESSSGTLPKYQETLESLTRSLPRLCPPLLLRLLLSYSVCPPSLLSSSCSSHAVLQISRQASPSRRDHQVWTYLTRSIKGALSTRAADSLLSPVRD
eukprot:340524-Hanusia_phi.AAC.4